MNEFSNIWRDMKQDAAPEQDTAKINMNLQSDVDPDTAARHLSLADEAGLPVDTVRNRESDVQKRLELQKYDANRIKKETPALAKIMENPDSAPVAKPDVEKMGYFEKLWGETKQSATRGLRVNEYGDIGMKRMIHGDDALTGEEKLAMARFRTQGNVDYNLSTLSRAPGMIAETALQLGSFVVDSADIIGTGALLGAGTGLAAGNLTGIGLVLPEEVATVPGGAIYGAARTAPLALAYQAFNAETGGAFNEYVGVTDELGQPIEREVAVGAAVTTGMINGALEYAGGKFVLKHFPGMDKVFGKFGREAIKDVMKTTAGRESMKRIAGAFTSSALVEGSTEAMQEIVNVIVGEAQKLASDGEFNDVFGNVAVDDGEGGQKEISFAEYTANVAAESFERGAIGGGGVSAIGTSLTIGAEATMANLQHKRDQRIMTERKELLREMEVGKRSPKVVKEFLQSLPDEDYYIKAEDVQTFFQSEAELNEFFSLVPAAQEQFQEAIEAGGDLVIPHEQIDQMWISTSEDQRYDSLQEFIKREPSSMTDAEMQEALDRDLDLEVDLNQELTKGEQLEQRLVGDIQNLSNRRVNAPRSARLYASAFRNAYETYQERIGDNPELDALMDDLFNRIRIKDGTEATKQRAGGLDLALNRLRSGGTKQSGDPSLIDFIRNIGGISQNDPLAGDVKTLDSDVRGLRRKDGKGMRLKKKSQRLLQEKGLPLDEIALRAWEAGYFPESGDRVDINTLIGAIDDELRGKPRFVSADLDDPIQAKIDEENQLAEILSEFNIPLDLDNDAIRQRLENNERGVPREIDSVFQEAAQKYGIDYEAFVRIAEIESSINPNAKNPNSSAGGLFQFIDSTAEQYGLTDKFDVQQATDAFARLFNDNKAALESALGREPTNAEMYLAHQQGAGGAINLLTNPDARAVDVVGGAAVRLNGGDLNMTAAEFSELWLNKYRAGAGSQTFSQRAASRVSTPEFQEWFGDSKVVDESGAPLVVYHGTNANAYSDSSIESFITAGERTGAFFSTDQRVAETYGEEIVPVYVSLQNPLIIDAEGRGWTDLSEAKILSEESSELSGERDRISSETDSLLAELFEQEGDNPLLQSDASQLDYFDNTGLASSLPNEPSNIDDLARVAKKFGYDGLIVRNVLDSPVADSPQYVADTVVALEGTQIKSVNNQGTFDSSDPRILFQDDNNLVAQHNLSLENLAAADQVGGLAVPSIAITRSQDTFDNFGEITLIGDRDLIDPKKSAKNKLFAADVYSPRYPRAEFTLNDNAFNSVLREIKEINGDIKFRSTIRLAEDIQRDGIAGILSNGGVQLAYLTKEGRLPEIPYREEKKHFVDTFPELGLDKYAGRDYQALARDEQFQADLTQFYEKNIDGSEMAERLRNLYFEDDGSLNFNLVMNYAREASAYVKQEDRTREIDDFVMERRVMEAIENEDGFEQWVKDTFSGVIKDERIFDGYTPAGDRKYLPHTLENVVKVMKRGLRDGEGFNYGLPSVRSKVAIQFNSIKDVKDNKNLIVSDKEFEAVKEEMGKEFDALADKLREYSPMGEDFGFMDYFSEHLKEIADTRNAKRVLDEYYADVPDALVEEVGDFMMKLRNMPTEYFEAKIQRAVGLSEFSGALVPKGKKYDKAVEILERNGLSNIERYDNNRQGALEKFTNLFFQRNKNDGPRGSVTFDAPGMETVIEVFRGGDMSTILHETGHVFLEIQRVIAEQSDAPQQIKDDYKKILDWLGVEKGSDIKTEHHEKFARGFEAYLMEGKAPSLDLKRAFEQFRTWLTRIYKDIRNLNAPLTKDVREVFDRMLATDEAIEQMREAPTMRPNPAMAEILTKAEYEAYLKQYQRSMDEAKDQLLRKTIRDMQKKQKQWWKDESEKVRREIEPSINSQAIHRAVNWLRKGEDLIDGDVMLENIRLSKKDIKNDYDAGYIDLMPRGVMAQGKGLHPQVVADYFGFRDADTMLDQLANYTERKDVVNQAVEDEMIRRHGDALYDRSIADEAEKAVENAMRGKMLHTEYQGIARRTGDKVATNEAYKDQAQKTINRTPINKLRPNDFYRAEVRAAREAGKHLKAKNFEKAAEAKRKELLNHHLYRAALEGRRMRDKMEKYVKTFSKDSKRQNIEKDVRDQIDRLLLDFGLNRNDKFTRPETPFSEFVQAREANGDIVYAPPVALGNGSDYRQLSVEDVSDLFDTIRNLEAIGRQERTLLVGQDKLTAEEARIASINSLTENNDEQVRTDITDTYYNRLKKGTRSIINNITRVEFLVKEMDGGVTNGAVAQSVINPLRRAAGARYEMLRDYQKQLSSILDANPNVKQWGNAKMYKFEDGREIKMQKKQVVMLALNMGNEGNLRNLISEDGHNFSDRDLDMLKAELTKEDWDTVQAVWDMFERIRPEIEKVNKRITNLDFKVVKPTEVQTPYGAYKGGYMPIVYDRESGNAPVNQESVQVNESNFEIPSVGRGFVKGRTKTDGAQVVLDFDQVVHGHLHETIHFVTHAQPVRQVNRIVSHKDFQSAVKKTFGADTAGEFRPWLSAIARDSVYDSPVAGLDKLIRHLRVGTSTIYMGFSTATGIKQTLGLTSTEAAVTRGDLKQKNYLKGMRAAAMKPVETVDFAFEHSTMLRERFEGIDADSAVVFRESAGKSVYNKIQRAGFAPIIYVQVFGVDVPTWHAGYLEGLERHEGNHEQAVSYADAILSQTQGSGTVMDLARVQRGGEFQKAVAGMFGTYMIGVLTPMMRQAYRDTKIRQRHTKAALTLLPMIVMPAIMEAYMSGDEPEDDETFAEWALLKSALYGASAVPVVGPLGTGLASDFDYRISPISSAINTVRYGYKNLESGEPNKTAVKGAAVAVGLAFRLPTYKPYQMIEEIIQVAEGEDEFSFREVFLGAPDDENR